MVNILRLLEEGDRRTTGDANRVAKIVLEKPDLIEFLFDGIYSTNPALRMRASDALEKVANQNHSVIQKYKKEIISLAKKEKQQEVAWHLAQILSYLKVSKKEKGVIKNILEDCLKNSKSNIVKVMSLQSLFDIFKDDKIYTSSLINKTLQDSSPALRARARKLKLCTITK